ncbi:MAG: hypothetical protein ISN26_04445 [Betaproteobacteria bacterium AqS2]|uniref:GP-PDE domain-containing protein n=1 Tax=Candidatus Amphirhobacter heronislandensis TaxID=1732024 RepID=A0A930UCC8_9GAMM|nr:hypothetical protein [Betaproteobacteria bacterium AqS2]
MAGVPARHCRLARLIGHRGAPWLCPENSLAGFERAAALGYRWVELDVQASRDGRAFVHHDYEIAAAGGRLLADMDAAELREVRLDEAGTPLPELEEVLVLARRLELGLVVEIKSREGRERRDADATLAALAAGRPANCMVASFQPAALEHVHAAAPELPLALNVMRLAAQAPPEVANIHFAAASAERGAVGRLRDAGYGLYAFTVNERARVAELLAMGAHGVFTDDHALLAETAP